jgi:peptidoglycan/xylan/chitin deacetylase (PgdA/CDA1 family)
MAIGDHCRSIQISALLMLLLLAGARQVLGLASTVDGRQREIAITFDDLPKVVPPPGRPEDTNQIFLSLTRMISVLRAHQAPAIGFVVGINLEGPDEAARLSMLRLWVRSGFSLGNHSYSHPNLCEPNGKKFNDDVLRGEAELQKVGDLGIRNKYFRLPYLCTGRTEAEKQAFSQFLRDRGVRNAPVTVEPGDYLFNELYVAARRKHDLAFQQRIRQEYLSRIDKLLEYFEGVSRDLFHREIRQVLLIHSNDLNSDCLDDVLRTIERRGYRFITLDRALEDPAYSTPDNYLGPMGISWLHRWKLALGKPLDYRSEPRIADWIVYQQEQLHQAQP